jgi:hypothetical protein
MSEEQLKSKLIALENIRHQFKQDCTLVFKGFVFSATVQTLYAFSKELPLDADGFPVPLDSMDVYRLRTLLEERLHAARRSYFERMGQIEKDYATTLPLPGGTDERTE